jgi:hypothetical protein
VITPAQASARKNPNKAFTLESTCGGGKFYLIAALQPLNFAATMAGGVFWVSENWFHLALAHWTTTTSKLQQATNPSTPSLLGVFVFCPFLLNVVEVVFHSSLYITYAVF